jgi:hypothetical protein
VPLSPCDELAAVPASKSATTVAALRMIMDRFPFAFESVQTGILRLEYSRDLLKPGKRQAL